MEGAHPAYFLDSVDVVVRAAGAPACHLAVAYGCGSAPELDRLPLGASDMELCPNGQVKSNT
jgi:hypothetical protein